eukprot:540312-Prymnesium_polylepis.1
MVRGMRRATCSTSASSSTTSEARLRRLKKAMAANVHVSVLPIRSATLADRRASSGRSSPSRFPMRYRLDVGALRPAGAEATRHEESALPAAPLGNNHHGAGDAQAHHLPPAARRLAPVAPVGPRTRVGLQHPRRDHEVCGGLKDLAQRHSKRCTHEAELGHEHGAERCLQDRAEHVHPHRCFRALLRVQEDVEVACEVGELKRQQPPPQEGGRVASRRWRLADGEKDTLGREHQWERHAHHQQSVQPRDPQQYVTHAPVVPCAKRLRVQRRNAKRRGAEQHLARQIVVHDAEAGGRDYARPVARDLAEPENP